MRKIILFGASSLLILFAIGMWAAAKPGDRNRSEISYTEITTFDLMVDAKDLPARQYDAN